MHDARMDKLAEVLVNHSTKVQPGENVLIEAGDIPLEMVVSLIRSVRKAGGVPMVTLKSNVIQRELIRGDDEATMKVCGDYEAYRMDKVKAYMALRGSHNVSELSDVSGPAMRKYEEHWLKPVHFARRVPKTKWVVLRWPTSSMAQQAQKSTEAFEDFYFDVCTLDYSKMEKASRPLKKMMEETDRVHILGKDTDLKFSIKDIPVQACYVLHH